ncbi:MAG: DUF5817 domain-containing protein [Halanaeroarchaeum sp.]
MYAVVGCSNCDALWVVADRPETTACPRCGKRHQFDSLKQFVTTEDEDHARDVRSALLAERQGESTAHSSLDAFGDMATALDDAGVSDDEYLERSGIDSAAVRDAGERATGGGPSRNRRDVVLDAVSDLDDPGEDDVVDYAHERGVSAQYVRRALEKLVRAGEVVRSNGGFRRV